MPMKSFETTLNNSNSVLRCWFSRQQFITALQCTFQTTECSIQLRWNSSPLSRLDAETDLHFQTVVVWCLSSASIRMLTSSSTRLWSGQKMFPTASVSVDLREMSYVHVSELPRSRSSLIQTMKIQHLPFLPLIFFFNTETQRFNL